MGTATQSDLDKSINKLKTRAGLPALTVNVGFSDPANDMGVNDLIWEVRRERRTELMFDNWARYWDLIRWHQLDKLDSKQYPDVLLGPLALREIELRSVERGADSLRRRPAEQW